MRIRALRWAAAALAIAALAGAPEMAEASYLAELSIEDRTDASAFIVEGEVQEVWTELDANGRVWTRARLRVDDQLKGERDITSIAKSARSIGSPRNPPSVS